MRPVAHPAPPPPEAAIESIAPPLFAEAVRRHTAGRTAEAETLYRALLALQPAHAQASYNLGLILQGDGRLDQAMIAYRHAIAIRPDYLDAYGNLGVALQASGRTEDAIELFNRLLQASPDFAFAAGNLGVALKALGRVKEAEAAYRRAIASNPELDWPHANLAALLLEQGDAAAAIASCRRAIALRPASELAHFNLGTACKAINRLAEAEAALRQAVALRPDFAEAHFTLGQVLLLGGAFSQGWTEYDWRWRLRDYGWLRALHGEFAQPLWSGEPLQGRTILVYAEQGLGDAIQFVRYVPLLVAQGAHVVLAVHPPLKALVAEMAHVTVIGLDERGLPPFDVHCPLLSLPGRFGTVLETIPAPSPYLHADPALVARWRPRLPNRGLRVGLVWAGNPAQTGDRFRSPRLEAIRPLFDVPGVSFVSLQMGAGRTDLAGGGLPEGVLDLGSQIGDFSDTAAIMAGLDLVVSSCTAPLHLAGALGVPVWGMIPFAPHYPWLLERTDTPWYPSMRLYRQDAAGHDWSGVVGRIASDLRRMPAADAATAAASAPL